MQCAISNTQGESPIEPFTAYLLKTMPSSAVSIEHLGVCIECKK
jgi:hypothetical protein